MDLFWMDFNANSVGIQKEYFSYIFIILLFDKALK